MSVRVTLSCPIVSEKLPMLESFLSDKLPAVRGFRGNRRVSVLFDTDHREMLLDEEWASVADHQSYLAAIENNGVMALLKQFLSGPPVIKYFQAQEL